MKRILVVTISRTENVEAMLHYMQQRMPQAQLDYTTYDEMILSFINGKMAVAVESSGLDLSDYDIAYFKSWPQYDISAAYVQYALQHGVKITDEAKGIYSGISKLYAYSVLAGNGVAVPDTIFTMSNRLSSAYDLYKKTLGLPFVLKDIHASRGNLNEVVRSREDFERVTALAREGGKKHYLIGQAFIPNEGDYRILVFGGEVKLAIHRMRGDDTTHLNNTSQGGTATIIPIEQLPAAVIEASCQAARLCKLGIAGVDMVQNKDTKQWYCFEVNEGPQMATGSHRHEKWDALAHYLITELEQ